MNRFYLSTLLWLALCMHGALPVHSQLPDFDIETIRTNLPLAMDSADVPGLSLSWLQEAEIYSEAFGFRDIQNQQLVSSSTIFEAASLSKPVLAYLTLRLVDKGKLHLDVPIVQIVPKEHLEKEFFKGEYPGRIFDLVTPRMLLTHSVGFPNWRQRQQAIKLAFKPGDRFQYSGEGFMLLQIVLEHISQKSLERLARTYVFDPLDMDMTGYVYQAEIHSQVATGYTSSMEPKSLHTYTTPAAAYSLLSTPSDYIRFMQAIMQGKGLKNETHQDMLRLQRFVKEEGDESYYWGLGIGLVETKYGKAVWHWGDNGPFKCFVIGFPEKEKAVVFFTNSQNGLSVGDHVLDKGYNYKSNLFSYLGYDQYPSAIFQIPRILSKQKSYPTSRALFDLFAIKKDPNEVFPEGRMQRLGYRYLQKGEVEAARTIFELNLLAHPESWNAYDSLAEAYAQLGNKDRAIQLYRESLKRNPANKNGKKMLMRLTGN
ncbi:MAG: serine hydrolase [Bacteroidia bacterium]